MSRHPVHACRAVSVLQMQRLDDAAIHTIGIPRLLLMDAAGRALAQALRALIPAPGKLLVCCGLGYNGGDGLCAAWYLARWGYEPRVFLAGERGRLKDEPAVYARILEGHQVRVHEVAQPQQAQVVSEEMRQAQGILDALVGIGLQGPVKPLTSSLITLINQSGKPVVAADIPSGLDADTGLPNPVAVTATVTVTFGLPKQGLLTGEGPAHAGDVIVDDIGMPASLLRPLA